MFSVGAMLVLAVIFLTGLHVYKWVKKRKQDHDIFRKIGVPFVKPHLIHGSFLTLKNSKNKNSIDFTTEWMNEHGKVFGMYSGDIPYLIVADLDMLKEILVKQFHNFANRPALAIDAYPVTDSLVGLRDHRWKQVRSILSPTFSMLKMKRMSGVINKKIDMMFNITEEKLSRNQNVEWYSTYQGLTLDTISETALAISSSCQNEQQTHFLLNSVREFLLFAINPAIICAICFPIFGKILAFISNTFSYSGRMTNMIVSHLKQAIKLRQQNNDEQCYDVLQLMLNSMHHSKHNSPQNNSDDINTNESKYLNTEEVIANAWVFLLGGFETTSSALTYTTYLLAHNPEVQQKLFEEISSHCENAAEHLTYDDIKSLTYLDQVVSESLRLFPPIVSFISREAKEDILINGLFIPKGMNIQVPVWQIHRDPSHWENPNVFDPQRFSNANCSKRHTLAYIPFGAGPRNCIGMRFAQLQAKLALSRVVLKYRLDVCEQTPEHLKLHIPTVAINPVDKIYVAVSRRSTG